MSDTQTNTYENLDYKALGGWIVEKNREVQQYIKATGGKWDDDRLTILKTRTAEVEGAQKRYDQLGTVEETYKRMVAQQKALEEPDPDKRIPFQGAAIPESQDAMLNRPNGASVKSIGEMFTDSQAYKSMGSHEVERRPYSFSSPDIDIQNTVKTVMTTSAGYAAPNPRTSIVVPFAQREARLADIIPTDPTTLSSIKYMEETTALAGSNAQVSITEGNAKFENTLAFTERTVAVETIGTWLPVTVQQLDDVPGIRGIIDNRLMEFLRLAEESLLLTGTGTPPQISGFLDHSVNTQARGTDTNADAVFKAIQQCRVTGFAEPDAIVMHPDNFTPIVLYKSTTGEYAFSPLSLDGGVTRLWGKLLVLSTAITSGTALVGAFRLYSHISRKMGMTIQVGLNNDDFTKNKRTLLAEFRESLEVYRDSAFTKCTGLQ
jgi:HK97 family phage major capsid protein